MIRLDRQPPLSQRVLLYYQHLREECHYIIVADVLRTAPERVQQACWHLAHAGHLRRVGDGVYALSEARDAEGAGHDPGPL